MTQMLIAAKGRQAWGNAEFGVDGSAQLPAVQKQKMRCIELLSGQSLFYKFASQQGDQVTQTI